MMSQKEGQNPTRFIFFGRWKFFAIYSVFVFICVGSLVDAAVTHQLTFALLGLLSLLLGFLAIGGSVFALSSAEVLVDAAGISRRLFGRTCQYIRWTDVKNIREERVSNRRVSVTVIRIIGKRGRVWGIDAATTITIAERCNCFEQLVDIMNEYVTINSIQVEVKINDVWQRESRIRHVIEEQNSFI